MTKSLNFHEFQLFNVLWLVLQLSKKSVQPKASKLLFNSRINTAIVPAFRSVIHFDPRAPASLVQRSTLSPLLSARAAATPQSRQLNQQKPSSSQFWEQKPQIPKSGCQQSWFPLKTLVSGLHLLLHLFSHPLPLVSCLLPGHRYLLWIKVPAHDFILPLAPLWTSKQSHTD